MDKADSNLSTYSSREIMSFVEAQAWITSGIYWAMARASLIKLWISFPALAEGLWGGIYHHR